MRVKKVFHYVCTLTANFEIVRGTNTGDDILKEKYCMYACPCNDPTFLF